MDQSFLDVLKRHAAGRPLPSDQVAEALDAACLRLADLLGGYAPSVRQDLLALIPPRILALLAGRKDAPDRQGAPTANDATDSEGKNGSPPPAEIPSPQPMKLTPELMEWYRRQTNVEEILAELREIQETGGLELNDFLPEFEKEFGLNE